ncbi:TetR/AcrR family transcriptional regulator, partial [Bacteroides acidifaciens]
KFRFKAATLSEFIEQYIKGVEHTMRKLVSLLDDGNNPAGCSFNFYYYHLLMQVRLYYPNVEKKIAGMFQQEYEFWREAIQLAQDNGEIRGNLDLEDTAMMFRQVFFGLSFEQSFLRGLDIQRLARELRFVYSLLKA